MLEDRKSRDWKFWVQGGLGTIGVIASIAAPYWLWNVDLTSKSLHFQLIAQTSLQPEQSGAGQGLILTVDGTAIDSPFSSVFDLKNTGSKPIGSADFEGPLELRTSSSTAIVRARVSSTNPAGISPELITSNQTVKIKPLLLNPGDVITIAILTSGVAPKFSASARVAGISGVTIDETIKKTATPAWINLVAAMLQFVLYGVFMHAAFQPGSLSVVSRRALILGLILLVGSQSSNWRAFVESMGAEFKSNTYLALFFALTAVGAFIGYWWNAQATKPGNR